MLELIQREKESVWLTSSFNTYCTGIRRLDRQRKRERSCWHFFSASIFHRLSLYFKSWRWRKKKTLRSRIHFRIAISLSIFMKITSPSQKLTLAIENRAVECLAFANMNQNSNVFIDEKCFHVLLQPMPLWLLVID